MSVQRTALITGASSGIGRATAQKFLENGYAVFGCARGAEQLESVMGELAELVGGEVGSIACDVSKPEDIERVVFAAMSRFGRIDVLVNNAGRNGGGVITDLNPALWDEVIATNLTSVFLMTQAVLSHSQMLTEGCGRVINVASTAGKQGVAFASPYVASKHGVIGFTKSVALELARQGVTVNAVCPGYVETPLAERVRQGYADHWGKTVKEIHEQFSAKVPIGRYCTPAEVAHMIAAVADSDASSITGQAINVCGGLGNF